MAKFHTANERWRLLFTRPNLLETREDEEAEWRVLRQFLAQRRRPAVSRRIVLRARTEGTPDPARKPCPGCFGVADSSQELIACSDCLIVFHASCASPSDPCPGCGIAGDPPPLPPLPWAFSEPPLEA